MFYSMQFPTDQNKRQATIRTWQVSMLICLGAHTTHAGKPTLGHLEMSNTFTTCCWNNVAARMFEHVQKNNKPPKTQQWQFTAIE
jgi:hypothetical protein